MRRVMLWTLPPAPVFVIKNLQVSTFEFGKESVFVYVYVLDCLS